MSKMVKSPDYNLKQMFEIQDIINRLQNQLVIDIINICFNNYWKHMYDIDYLIQNQ